MRICINVIHYYNWKFDKYSYLIYQPEMGNKMENKNNDEFIKAVSQMKRSKNEYPVHKVSTHLEQKYRDHMINTLRKQQMPKVMRKLLQECIDKKIKKQDLTSTIAVLNSLRSNNAEQLLKSSTSNDNVISETKNVVVKFDNKKPKSQYQMQYESRCKNRRKQNQQSKSLSNSSAFQYLSIRQEDTLQGRIKYTGQFICKQLNKSYHPFRILCKRFSDILFAYEKQHQRQSSQKYKQKYAKQSSLTEQQQYEQKQENQRKSIKQFTLYLVHGCLGIYRKWIIQYTGIQDKKYEKWMYSLCLNEMWVVNDGLMADAIQKVIQRTRVQLQLDLAGITKYSTAGLLQPKDFMIDTQLQIQGHYYHSIMNMSSISEKKKPSDIIKQLEVIKKSICLDIDCYHKLQQKEQVYQVNGDNIMGIIAYVMSKMPDKIQQISNILLFLRIIYGDAIYYNMDTSSYMYSTIWGAIEYLQSKEFEPPSLKVPDSQKGSEIQKQSQVNKINQSTSSNMDNSQERSQLTDKNQNIEIKKNENSIGVGYGIADQVQKQFKDTSCISYSQSVVSESN